MSYCEQHLKKEKGSLAGEIALIVAGIVLVLFGGMIIAAMIYAMQWGNIVGFGMAIGLILVALGVYFLVYAGLRRKKRHAVEDDVEQSELVRSIRALMPPEHANRTPQGLFRLVDQDLAGGKHFGRADIGREWVLIGERALRTEGILGAFLYEETHRSSKVSATLYSLWVYDHSFRGANLVFPLRGTAENCYQALVEAAPHARKGGKREEEAFLKEMRAIHGDGR